LQPGHQQVAAGYVVYGSSTILVYTAGRGVYGFTLDPSVGAYVLSHDNLRMPTQGGYYSANEANADSYPGEYRAYLAKLRSGKLGRSYSSRYIGSLVADFHRTLLKGGVFLYLDAHVLTREDVDRWANSSAEAARSLAHPVQSRAPLGRD
jgi:fructose-1,6-bisphosphatase I